MNVYILHSDWLEDCWESLEICLTSSLGQMNLQVRLVALRLRRMLKKTRKMMMRRGGEFSEWVRSSSDDRDLLIDQVNSNKLTF